MPLLEENSRGASSRLRGWEQVGRARERVCSEGWVFGGVFDLFFGRRLVGLSDQVSDGCGVDGKKAGWRVVVVFSRARHGVLLLFNVAMLCSVGR